MPPQGGPFGQQRPPPGAMNPQQQQQAQPPPPPAPPPPAQLPQRRTPHQNGPPRQPLSATMDPGSAAGPRPPAPTPGTKVDGPLVSSTGDKYGIFRLPTGREEYATCEKRFDWLQMEKNQLEKSLNKLATEKGVPGLGGKKPPPGTPASVEEGRLSEALGQIGREMSALRLVMKKYTNDQKKGLLMNTATF